MHTNGLVSTDKLPLKLTELSGVFTPSWKFIRIAKEEY